MEEEDGQKDKEEEGEQLKRKGKGDLRNEVEEEGRLLSKDQKKKFWF